MKKLLLIEDEEILAAVIKEYLILNGFDVSWANDGVQGLELFRTFQPDIIVSDISLPNIDGYTVAKEIRRGNAHIPIIFLTSKHDTSDVLHGFESGANDYVRKPFSIEELKARINVQLQQQSSSAVIAEIVNFGKYKFVFNTQSLSFDDKQVILTYRETLMLKMLCDNINDILPRETALQEIWGSNSKYNIRTMDVYISKLRRILIADDNVQLVNVRGFGYKLVVKE